MDRTTKIFVITACLCVIVASAIFMLGQTGEAPGASSSTVANLPPEAEEFLQAAEDAQKTDECKAIIENGGESFGSQAEAMVSHCEDWLDFYELMNAQE